MSLQSASYGNNVEPLSFSTFHLLRTCNRLMLPNTDASSYYNLVKDSNALPLSNTLDTVLPVDYGPSSGLSTSTTSKSPILDVMDSISLTESNTPHDTKNTDKLHPYESPDLSNKRPTTLNNDSNNDNTNAPSAYRSLPLALPPLGMLPLGPSKPPAALPAFEYIAPANHATATLSIADFPLMELNRVGVFPAFLQRRARGEKRPIPDEQKDEKYYERRKRNNEAAKKSRDARKIREDRIAFRAALLEQENSILRAQVLALRDELQTMRQLIGAGASTLATNVAMSGRAQL